MPLRRVANITIPTSTSATRKVIAAADPQVTEGCPGKKVRGIRLYQPAPNPDNPARKMRIATTGPVEFWPLL